MAAVPETLTGGVPTPIVPVKTAPQMSLMTESRNNTIKQVPRLHFVLVGERFAIKGALASSSGHLWLYWVMFSCVPFIVVKGTPHITVINISDPAIVRPFELTSWRKQDVH